MAAASGIRVPCYWPDCQERISLNSLAQHIETRHGVKKGFGCDYCGFTDSKEDLVRSHTFEEHGRQGTIRPATKALAHYYRRRYQESNPHLRKIGGREAPRVNNPPKTAATTAVTSSHLTRKLPFGIFARSILSLPTWTLRESGVDMLKSCLTSPQAVHLS